MKILNTCFENILLILSSTRVDKLNVTALKRGVFLFSTEIFALYLNSICFSVSPMLVVPNQLVGAPLGTDVTVDCLTEAYPRPISFWLFHDSRTMIFSGSKHHLHIQENGYKIHMKLTIRALSSEDYGSYKCVTKNSLGEAEGSMRIYGKLKYYKL